MTQHYTDTKTDRHQTIRHTM